MSTSPHPSLLDVADRLALHDLISRYTYVIDFRRYDEFVDLFTPDAVIDYTATGGTRGSPTEIKAFLEASFGMIAASQHLVGSIVLDLHPGADEATGHVMCHNPMVFAGPDGSPGRLVQIGLWYHDRYRRTADGWRFAERVEEQSYAFLPDGKPFRVQG